MVSTLSCRKSSAASIALSEPAARAHCGAATEPDRQSGGTAGFGVDRSGQGGPVEFVVVLAHHPVGGELTSAILMEACIIPTHLSRLARW